MSRYLLDTGVLAAYLKGRNGAVALVDPWVHASEAATSIVVYGEIVEYLQGLADPDYARHLGLLRGLLQWQVYPFPLTYAILERYAGLRRALRSPNGPGLIGDIDTLIAATAFEYGLEIVTTDSDYARVPNLSVQVIPRAALR